MAPSGSPKCSCADYWMMHVPLLQTAVLFRHPVASHDESHAGGALPSRYATHPHAIGSFPVQVFAQSMLPLQPTATTSGPASIPLSVPDSVVDPSGIVPSLAAASTSLTSGKPHPVRRKSAHAKRIAS